MAAAERSTAMAERIDREVMGDLAISDGGRAPAFTSMREVLEFAKVMAVSGIAIRAHLRNNPGACAAICMQAQRWQMDAFTVANKSYAVNDQLAYESQLITAVINTRAPIRGRLKTRFEGAGIARRCIAWATFEGEAEPTEVESPPIGSITPKNSPLWKTDPDQQLAYYTKRLWARRECPEVLLGVYDPDELDGPPPGPDHARDVTPPARPTRADFRPLAEMPAAEPDPWELTDNEGEVRTYSSHLDWCEAFCEFLSTPHASWASKEGSWETNSPQIGRLRQMADGEKLAQEIHDAFARARAAEDERLAAERAEAEKQQVASAEPIYDPFREYEAILEGAKAEKTAAALADYWRIQAPVFQRLAEAAPDVAAELDGKVRALHKSLRNGAGK